MPPNLSGVTDLSGVVVTPDGHAYVYEYERTLSDLYPFQASNETL